MKKYLVLILMIVFMHQGAKATPCVPMSMDTCIIPQAIVAYGLGLSCANPTTTLVGNSASTDVTFQWRGPNNTNHEGMSWTVSEPGNYVLVVANVSDSTCMDSTSLWIIQDTIRPTFVTSVSDSCLDSCLTILENAYSPLVSFEWTTPLGQVLQGDSIDVCLSGVYNVVATDSINGCSSMRAIEISDCVVAYQDVAASKLSIRPTVSNDIIEIGRVEDELLNVQIFTITGIMMKTTKTKFIDVSNFPKGQYYIKAQLEEGKIAFGRFIVE